MANNIVANNSAAGISCDYGYGKTLYNNNVFGNTPNYVNVTPNSSNKSEDPQFADDDPDYHLTHDSPCVDTGLDSVVQPSWLDIDGEPRQLDILPGGTLVDIGADEHYPDYTSSAMVNRGLPSSNLNNAAGSARCNIRWAEESSDIVYGDDFDFADWAGPSWRIDKIRVWVVPDVPLGSYPLGDHYTTITLYKGETSGQLTPISTGTLEVGSNTVTTSDGTAIDLGLQYYAGGLHYQAADGRYNKIWTIEFDLGDVEWTVADSETAIFAVNGVPRYDRLWFIHATHFAPASGKDGQFYAIDTGTFASSAALCVNMDEAASDLQLV